ncbi:hypothetical protein cand_030650 [Cryptosporidium andersoni]|uniref:Uncharacterized protein n=1 Tax=Cryptosporidium andersoni TaxID=117008 RepID=A0A1J4MQB7_9CRYT|nr:hypothetical protein cand_030650 [Cryptosporidium andersoni]
MQISCLEFLNSLDFENAFSKRGIISTLVGILLGLIVSITVNSTLVEISLSLFFSTYFGLLFIGIGCLIYWRVSVTFQQVTEEQGLDKRRFLLIFAGIIMLSGLLCFMLEKEWFTGLSPLLRVPIYSILGLSISFALAFSLVDVVNYISGLIMGPESPLLISSRSQILLVISSSLIMGCLFGLIFGLVEDSHSQVHYINISLMKQKHYCYTIGIIQGAICGFGNEVLRVSDKSYMIMGRTTYDSEV